MALPIFKDYNEMSIEDLQSDIARRLPMSAPEFHGQEYSVNAAMDTLMNENFPDESCQDSIKLLFNLGNITPDSQAMVLAFVSKARPDIQVPQEILDAPVDLTAGVHRMTLALRGFDLAAARRELEQ